MASADEPSVVARLRQFCEARNLSTTGIVGVTIQRNFTGEYASLFGDLDNECLLTHYPADELSSYDETRLGDLNVCYRAGLPPPPANAQIDAGGNMDDLSTPFCCGGLQPYRPRQLQAEAFFTNFLNGRGHHPNLFIQVVRQVDNGPIIATTLYKLTHDAVHRVWTDNGSLSKMHAFKNYKCAAHNRFFGVDLSKEGPVVNRYHMRLSPFQRRSPEIEAAFFAACG